MKHFFVTTFIATLMTASLSFAQVPVTDLPTSLGKTMKAMSADLKALVVQANDASKNESSAVLADHLAVVTLHAKDFSVDSIKALPADQQALAKADYDKMLDSTAAVAQQLAAAFRANDNTLAASLLKQLSQDKKDGHDKFKKD